jgi:hypothetical protein
MPRKLLFAALTLGVIVRLVVALYLGSEIDAPSMLTDQRSYHALAIRLIAGHGYSFATGWYPNTPPSTPTAFWSFLYPIVLVAIYTVTGPNVLAARIVQAFLAGVLLPYAAYRFTQRLFPARPRLAAWALLLTACYAYFILYAATLMTESLYIICLLWSLCAALDLEAALRQGQPVPRRVPWKLGLSLGLATLLRQAILPWVPVLFAYLLWQARGNVQTLADSDAPRSNVSAFRCATFPRWRAVGPLVVSGVILAACILPFTVRNYIVYDTFLLLNSNTGYAMYSAQHPMHGDRFDEFTAAPLPDDLRGQGLNEAQLDRELLRRGIQFVLDEPVRYLRLSLSRVRAYFSLLPGENTTPLHALGRFAAFGAYLPLWLYGAYLALRSSALRGRLGLPLLFMAFYTLMHTLTWAMVRYRLPVDAVAMPLAALAVDDLWRRLPWTKQRSRLSNAPVAAGGSVSPSGDALSLKAPGGDSHQP